MLPKQRERSALLLRCRMLAEPLAPVRRPHSLSTPEQATAKAFLLGRLFAPVLVLLLSLVACTEQPSYWSESERALLRSISLESLSALPESPSNSVANNPRAIALGKALFFDTRLSGNGKLSCASCHQAARQFTDGREQGHGVNPLTRNTPSLIGGAWQHWFYWDGRRDSLWSQALIPIEAPDEMGGSRVGAVRLIARTPAYAEHYTALFGALPPALRSEQLPEHAGEFAEADARDAWYRLPQATRTSVNRAYANIGKAIAAFERTLIPKPSAFDTYVKTLIANGEKAAQPLLSPAAQRGAKLFIDSATTRCLQCHNGPLLTNGDFHNIGTGTLLDSASAAASGRALDFGRLLGVQAVLLDEFNCLGPHSDAQQEQCSALRFLANEQHGDIAGAYKTPSLRHVEQTAPYMHDGRFASLADVMQHYNNPPTKTPHELAALTLSDKQTGDLVAFLQSLSSAPYEEYVATATTTTSEERSEKE